MDKDDRTIGQKIEDTITWGISAEDRKRAKEGKPSVEQEQADNAPSLFSSEKRYGEHR